MNNRSRAFRDLRIRNPSIDNSNSFFGLKSPDPTQMFEQNSKQYDFSGCTPNQKFFNPPQGIDASKANANWNMLDMIKSPDYKFSFPVNFNMAGTPTPMKQGNSFNFDKNFFQGTSPMPNRGLPAASPNLSFNNGQMGN